MGAWADILCVFAGALLVIGWAEAAPAGKEDVIYDQRQNGTENYRLHIDGVVIAVAPAEMLLNLADLVDFSPSYGGGSSGGDGGSDGDFGEEDLSPPKPEESSSALETTTAVATEGVTGDTPTKDASESADKPADKPEDKPADKPAADAPTTPKPPKRLKGKLVLSQWLLPLLRRL